MATLRSALRKGERRLLPIAAFPLLFAAQQAVEGALWLDLARPQASTCRPFLIHAFLGYAEVFWPVFAPVAALLIEPARPRRWLMAACLAVGGVLAAYLLFKMIGNPYEAAVVGGHIVYDNGAIYPRGIESAYVLATTVPLLLSSHRLIRLLGAIILGGFAGAWLSIHQAYVSVWCFVAAIASVLVYLFVQARPRRAIVATRG
ncbi:MAG: hypothetical protein IT536_12545 [Hyphomicrobiales bacterium]|nr:hypothetical protein [Hyphomicrobiales bacterium]